MIPTLEGVKGGTTSNVFVKGDNNKQIYREGGVGGKTFVLPLPQI